MQAEDNYIQHWVTIARKNCSSCITTSTFINGHYMR